MVEPMGVDSADGMVLAYAAADYSIGLLDARTLAVRHEYRCLRSPGLNLSMIPPAFRSQPLLKILHAHSFAITALAFNPSGNLLASAGADNTVRLIVIPASFGSCEFRRCWDQISHRNTATESFYTSSYYDDCGGVDRASSSARGLLLADPVIYGLPLDLVVNERQYGHLGCDTELETTRVSVNTPGYGCLVSALRLR